MVVKKNNIQVEPGGITYDRFRLEQIFYDLVDKYGITRALEMAAGGEKAMPSIYSIGLARAGCNVTLVNPTPKGLKAWSVLGLDGMVQGMMADPANTGLEDRSYDLVWNFVSLSKTADFRGVLAEMARLSRHLVLTVHTNGFNVGYPWHRLLHYMFGFPWTHGDTRYSFPAEVLKAYRSLGLEVLTRFPFDSPPWPDPPGFRDVRLHRQGVNRAEDESIEWKAPIIDYCVRGQFPLWMRLLSRIERLPLPRFLKYPVSHLFLVLGKVSK
ncbi:methyltransferase domain-containing protein [Acidobacteriota bacterium]